MSIALYYIILYFIIISYYCFDNVLVAVAAADDNKMYEEKDDDGLTGTAAGTGNIVTEDVMDNLLNVEQDICLIIYVNVSIMLKYVIKYQVCMY